MRHKSQNRVATACWHPMGTCTPTLQDRLFTAPCLPLIAPRRQQGR
ncbi:MAG: hypothetical protein OXC07_10940 [Kistimonas sp.]|nr:hypothetical protein [Kistimonas sp.]